MRDPLHSHLERLTDRHVVRESARELRVAWDLVCVLRGGEWHCAGPARSGMVPDSPDPYETAEGIAALWRTVTARPATDHDNTPGPTAG